jgi:capsular polysaccharide biosynthesis protein
MNAKKYLEGILENLLSEHGAIFESFNSDTRERLTSLVKQINQIDNQIDLNDSYLNSIKFSNPTQSSIIAIERGRLLSEKGNLEERIYMMKMALSKLNTKNTQVIKHPGMQKKPVKPNKRIIALLSIIIGLVLAVMAALFSEFISNSKTKINSSR